MAIVLVTASCILGAPAGTGVCHCHGIRGCSRHCRPNSAFHGPPAARHASRLRRLDHIELCAGLRGRALGICAWPRHLSSHQRCGPSLSDHRPNIRRSLRSSVCSRRTHSPGLSNFAENSPKLASDFIYFSFVTLTTVGYGDIVPVHPHRPQPVQSRRRSSASSTPPRCWPGSSPSNSKTAAAKA